MNLRLVRRFVRVTAFILASVSFVVAAKAANSLSVTITDMTTGNTSTQTQSVADVNGDYNVDLTVGAASPPFQNVSLHVLGNANPPGAPTTHLLPNLSTNVTATNFTGVTHEFKIVFDAVTYTLPAATPVDILTQIDTNDATRADLSHASLLTASTAGGATFTRTVPLGNIDGSQIDGGFHANAGSYTMEQSYDLFVLGSGNGQVKVLMNMTVVPEPSTVVLAMVALPIVYLGRRFAGRTAPCLAR